MVMSQIASFRYNNYIGSDHNIIKHDFVLYVVFLTQSKKLYFQQKHITIWQWEYRKVWSITNRKRTLTMTQILQEMRIYQVRWSSAMTTALLSYSGAVSQSKEAYFQLWCISTWPLICIVNFLACDPEDITDVEQTHTT